MVPQPLCCVTGDSVITGADFSTGSVKFLAFDLDGHVLADVKFPTDQWTEGGVRELNLMQLEGQVHASLRELAAQLREKNRLAHWVAGGISATHHTAGRIDVNRVQVRRAICWNDHTLAEYHKQGLERLGGQDAAKRLIGGPWAIRYTLSHLLKDEATLEPHDWHRTWRVLTHGALVAGYLTGNFDVISVSSAASTGLMDLRTCAWCPTMAEALEDATYRYLALKQLPKIIDQFDPVGSLAMSLAMETGIEAERRPMFFPTSDDQQAGLVGGGAVEDGQLAIVLGNSAVVNSSSSHLPESGTLDVMRLNWGPYLWMRCYNNGAQFLDEIVGKKPDWDALERAGSTTPAGCNGVTVLPFAQPEPSRGVSERRLEWSSEPSSLGVKFRACLEALAYLIALGVEEHEKAGQKIQRITVSGGIAKSDLMCEILATVLNRPLEKLVSSEGPALGAAVTALAAMESYQRGQRGIKTPYTVADAVGVLVKFRGQVTPNREWLETYGAGLEAFREKVSPTCTPSASTSPSAVTTSS